MQKAAPDISVRAEIGMEPELMTGLVEGRLDIAVMYTPQSRPGLKVEWLFEERLVLVSSNPQDGPEPGAGYVYVDWGPEFYAKHAACYPDFIGPALTASIGWVGLQHILGSGGAGYFPTRIVQEHLKSGRLAAIRGAPEFSLPAYVVYPQENDPAVLETALGCMRQIAAGV